MSNVIATDDKAVARKERGALRKRMRDLLLLLPNLLKLMLRLVRDPRVSRADKVILGGAILYVIAPLDFIRPVAACRPRANKVERAIEPMLRPPLVKNARRAMGIGSDGGFGCIDVQSDSRSE